MVSNQYVLESATWVIPMSYTLDHCNWYCVFFVFIFVLIFLFLFWFWFSFSFFSFLLKANVKSGFGGSTEPLLYYQQRPLNCIFTSTKYLIPYNNLFKEYVN